MRKLIQRWKGMPDSAKASIIFAVCTFVTRGISFITTPIYTRIMDQTQYGLIATYNSWVLILEVFALLGLTSAGVFNVGLNDYADTRDQYMSSMLTLVNLVTIIVFPIIFAAKAMIGENGFLPNNLLVLMLIHFLFSPAQVFWITRQRYEYKYRAVAIITILSAVVSQALSVIAVINNTSELGTTKLWASELGQLLFALPIYLMLLFRGRMFFSASLWKGVLVFAIPLIPHYLAQHVMSGADRIMIAEMVSQADAAIYSVAFNISTIALIFWNAINASLIPYTFDKIKQHKSRDIHSVVYPILVAYGIVCILVVVVAPEILAILAPQEYQMGVYIIPPIACITFANAMYNLYANIEFYYKKSKNIASATIVATLVNLVLNAILIPKFSYIGAAYTTLISYYVLILMHYLGYRKATPERVYKDKEIFSLMFVVTILCLLGSVLYSSNVIRYTLIIVASVIVVVNRKTLFNIARNYHH